MDVAKGIVAKRLQELVRVEESVVIPTGRLPYLMGAKGARIRQLQVRTCGFAALLTRLPGPHVPFPPSLTSPAYPVGAGRVSGCPQD